MKEYIRESALSSQNNRKEYLLFNRIVIQITDPLQPEINIKHIISTIEKRIPKHLLDDLETIYIGQYKPLIDRQINSLYVNGSIMISNDETSQKELFGTFIHEIAHAAEEKYKDLLYEDGKLSKEFISKRLNLYNMLCDDYDLNKESFVDINFNQNFDDFAYKTVGYDNLGIITNGLFISPYACTSLREYFANGFEHYFLKEAEELQEISPILFKKIKLLLKTT